MGICAVSKMAQRVAFAAGATLAAGIGLYIWWKQRKGSTPRPPFLDNPKPSDPRKKMTLVRKDKISHDTWRFVFALGSRATTRTARGQASDHILSSTGAARCRW